MRARLDGFAFWTPGHRDVRAWLAGAPADESAMQPDASLLPSRLRRRTALLTRMVCEVVARAAEQGGADLGQAQIVLASGWGEFETTAALLPQLVAPRPEVSPTLFHNSVYNTAPGYISIVHANHNSSTAIGAGVDSLAAGMIEALSMLTVDRGEVLLVVGDERIPAPFEDPDQDSVVVGLCLRAHDDPRPGGLRLHVSLEHGDYPTPPHPFALGRLATNPCAAVVPLAHAIGLATRVRVPLQAGTRGWLLAVEPEATT